MYKDKKIELINSQFILTQCIVEFAINLVLNHKLNFFIVNKRISGWNHFFKRKFLYIVKSAGGSFSQLFKSFKFRNGSRMSNKKLVTPEFKYL